MNIDALIRDKEARIQQLQADLAALRRVKAMAATETASTPGAAPARRGRPPAQRPRQRRRILSETPSPRRGQFSATSQMGCAIRVLEDHGGELHVDEIIKRMAARGVKAKKSSVVGGMFRLAKEQRVFYKAAQPNSFGLLGRKRNQSTATNGAMTMSP